VGNHWPSHKPIPISLGHGKWPLPPGPIKQRSYAHDLPAPRPITLNRWPRPHTSLPAAQRIFRPERQTRRLGLLPPLPLILRPHNFRFFSPCKNGSNCPVGIPNNLAQLPRPKKGCQGVGQNRPKGLKMVHGEQERVVYNPSHWHPSNGRSHSGTISLYPVS
jgi:hypothetical protein